LRNLYMIVVAAASAAFGNDFSRRGHGSGRAMPIATVYGLAPAAA
jgi:hypothetical protein